MEQTDYHVGLLRGFILAHNAPTIILHALDVVVPVVKRSTNEMIGKPAPTSETPPKQPTSSEMVGMKPAAPPPPPKPAQPRESEERSNFFWTPEHDKILEDMWKAGASVSDISSKLNRTPASIYSRVNNKGLKR